MFRKEFEQNVIDYTGFAFKAMSVHYMFIVMGITQIVVVWMSLRNGIFPEEDNLLQLISDCAQIISGLYGITLAGYTFFLSRIDALMATDMTLDYIVLSVKNRFKYLIWYITFNVGMTLVISVVLLYYPTSSNIIPEFLYRLICNEFIVFLAFSMVLIFYYSLSVIDPNCLEREAAKLQKKISRPSGKMGSVVEYISLYDQIEARCNEMIPTNVLSQLHENKGKRFEYTIELLGERNDKNEKLPQIK